MNRLFRVRNIDADGNCDLLCILYAFVSMNENIQKEICSNMKTYLQNHWLTSYIDVNDVGFFSISGIRQSLLYAKLDDSTDMSEMVHF